MRGSYTVEAAIWVPVFLFVVMLAMKAGLVLYQEIRKDDSHESLVQMWEAGDFYRAEWLEEIADGKDSEL